MAELEEENTGDAAPKKEVKRKKRSALARVLRFSRRFVLSSIFIFILLALFVQLQSVQDWAIQKVTTRLSDDLKTTVKIDRFSLDFFDELSIRDIFIGNQNAPTDTLAAIGTLRVDVSYWHLLFGIVQLDAIRLEKTTVRLHRMAGEYDSNLQFVLNYFDPPREGPPSPPKPAPDIRVGQIHLRDIDFSNDDFVRGKRMAVRLKALDLHTNIINLPKKLLDITRINVYDPDFKMEELKEIPLPPKPKVQKASYSKQSTPSVSGDKNEQKMVENVPPSKPFQLLVGAISVENGKFKLDNWTRDDLKPLPKNLLDYRHLDVFDININIHNFMFFKDEFTGVVDGINLRERSGFELIKLVVGDAKVSPTETALYGLQIETPYSLVGDTLKFIYPEGYTSFRSFDDKVTMDIRLHSGRVLIDDIMTFAVGLESNPFFVRNRQALAKIEARVFGKVNTLKLPNFDIALGNGFQAAGKFESRNLKDDRETYVNLDLKRLRTTMPALRELIPNFKPSDQFNKLGNLDFEGEFFGFLTDFTAIGKLKTDLGGAGMNTKLVIAGDKTTYNGKLNLINFDLGSFLDDKNLGKVTLTTEILRGRGFNDRTLDVNLTADIQSFQIKNYDYRNAKLTGNFARKLFSGKLESKDPNADFLFDGTIDFAAATPVFKFKSDILRVDLQTLNLAKMDLAVAGNFDLDLTGQNIGDLRGSIDAKNVVLIKNKDQRFALDALKLRSTQDPDGKKHFELTSELLALNVDGFFELDKLHQDFIDHFAKFHPRFALDLGMKPTTPIVGITLPPLKKADEIFAISTTAASPTYGTPQRLYNYKVNVEDTKNWTYLIDNQLDTLRKIKIEGDFDAANDVYNFGLDTEETQRYGNVKLVALGVTLKSNKEDLDWNVLTYNCLINNDLDFQDITFNNRIVGDTAEFGLTSTRFSQKLRLKNVELNAMLMRQDSFYKLSFGSDQLSRINILEEYWNIAKDNYLLIGKNYLDIKGFDLHNGDRQITLESCEGRGLNATLNNFSVDFVNAFMGKEEQRKFKLGGKYFVNLEFEDVFKQENFKFSLSMDSFFVKDEFRGALRVSGIGKDFKSPIYTNVLLIDDEKRLTASGFYYPKATENFPENAIDVNLGMQNFPFKTLQLVIENGASNFKGSVDAGVRISGPVKNLDYKGNMRIRNGGVTIDYLKLPIVVRDETVKVTSRDFDFTGCSLFDSLGHRARLSGKLAHNRFKRFALENITVRADTFLMLNTTRYDNPLYFGTGIGSGEVTFTGDFERTNIKIRAKTGRNTKITFPFAAQQSASETGFVVFKANQNTEGVGQKPKNSVEQRGINLDMDLSITDQAEMTLIFNEISGDNIRGRGTGDINLSMNRSGEMKMTGECRISQGDYLFTLFRVVNKNFALKPGGIIRWNGSPLDATINIDAGYKNLNTSTYNFIAEYVENEPNAKQESQKPTPVDLTLKLSGALLRPDINFDLSFPNLTPNIRSYAETKLRLLRQDQSELNRQVFGLVVVGGFLPSDVAFLNGSQLRSGSINTLTETASTIVSNIFTQFLSEYVTGLDLQVGYNVYEFDRFDPLNPNRAGSTGQQFRLRGSYNLDDRWTVSGGVGVEQGDYLQTTIGSNVFVGGDVIIDYAVSEDRRLKLRLSYTRDQVFEGRRDKPAAGIRFRQEFDNFDELINSVFQKKKESNVPKSDYQ